MATKKKIKELLKELRLTEQEMDVYWSGLKDTNSLVRNLSKHGKTWRDLNESVIRDIPTQKERDIAQSVELKLKEEQKKQEDKQREDQHKYYIDNFEKLMIDKIEKGDVLIKSELRSLVLEYEHQRLEGDTHRWHRDIQSIVELKGSYFSINWSMGLTEMQPNEYTNQPVEVVLRERIETIKVQEWVQIDTYK